MGDAQNDNEPTTVAAYTEAVIRALELKGIDPQLVLREVEFERARGNDPMLRITDAHINAIFARAVALTGDPCFGLRVAESVVPGMLHALGYALLASETLEDMCGRLARYYALVSQNATMHVDIESDALLLRGELRNPGLCHETVDAWAGVVLRLARAVAGDEFRLLQLELLRPEPVGGGAPFRDFFGCPVHFGAPRICLHFDLAAARRPLPGASRELAEHNDRIALAYLEKLERDDIVTRVRMLVVKGLGGGSVGRSEVAARLHMSASTLQAKLARRGVSFQQVLDGTRYELALAYVDQSRLSITEVAFMLGFSDVSNFNRAFRRWTGMAPTEYRERTKRGQA